jgi:hypothetical protein
MSLWHLKNYSGAITVLVNVKTIPFHITLTSIMQDQSGKRVDLISQGLMLKPFSDGI